MMRRNELIATVVLVTVAIIVLAWAWDTPSLLAILAGWALGLACVVAWEAEP